MKKSSFEYEKGQFEYEKGRPKTDPPFFIDLGGLPWCMIPRWKDLAISNTMVVFNLHKYAFKVTISFEYEKVLCFSLGSVFVCLFVCVGVCLSVSTVCE